MLEIFDETTTQPDAAPASAAPTYHAPPMREPGEPAHEYQARILCYALEYPYRLDTLTCTQLEAADTAAAWSVAALPAKLDPDAARLDATLHTLRHRIAHTLTQRRAQLARTQAMIDALYPPPSLDPDAPPDPHEDPQAHALRLLRAALMLIMGPAAGPGSSGARLQPPRPHLPNGGIALDPNPPRGRF